MRTYQFTKKQSFSLCSVSLVSLMTFGVSSSAFGALTVYGGTETSTSNPYNSYNNNSSYNNIPNPYNTSTTSSSAYQPSSSYNAYKSYNQSNSYQRTPTPPPPAPSYNSNSYQSTPSSYQPSSSYNAYKSYSPPTPSYNSYNTSSYNSSSYNTSSYTPSYDSSSSYNSSSYDSYEQGNTGSMSAMYAEYSRLQGQLSTLSPSSVTSFAQRYPKSALAEKLVADYAETKAGMSDYRAIQQASPYIVNADDSEACALAIGDIRQNTMRIAEQKSKVWLNTLEQPNLCNQFASSLVNHNMVSNSDRMARLYRVLRVGKTGDIISLANTLGIPIDYTQLSSIRSNLNGFFSRFASQGRSQVNQYLYLYAIGRLTDKSFQEASMQLNYDVRQYGHLLDANTRRMAYRTIAVTRMNMNTNNGFNHEAVTWFRNSLGVPFNYEEAEDYAMASIRFSEWQDLINAITSMDGSHRQEDIWLYWLARGYEQTGQRGKARPLYRQVAQKNNYYGYLAKDRIGQPINISSMGMSLPNVSTQSVTNNEHFSRALSLHYSGDKNDAKREWNWGVRSALADRNYPLLLAAAKKAHDIGWYDRSIYAMEMANDEMGQMNVAVAFPMPRKNSVVRYSQQVGIDPAWAYGIMRQESRFNVGARSHVGAGGLMQIMPKTARYIARKLGERYSSRRVASGDTNIRYGTWYMSDVLGGLNGQVVLATAGYNAGPSRARTWQPTYSRLSADQYVETIPFPETRNYVKAVMENSTIYGYLLGRPMSITQRMGTIYPK